MSAEQIGRIVVVEATEPTPEETLYPRVAGALLGGAIADALGWPTEFAKSPDDLARMGLNYPIRDFVPWPKRTGGRFFTRIDNIQPGDYSDDTQLSLCVVRSLDAHGSVDNEYFAKAELKFWLDYARGAGATVTAAAKSAARIRSDWRWNFFTYTRGRRALDYREAGANGAAMRISPIALANLHDPVHLVEEVWRNAIVTHGHPRAILGALVYGEALRRLTLGDNQSADEYIADLRSFVEGLDPTLNNPDLTYWRSRWKESGVSFEARWPEYVAEMTGMLETALTSRSGDLRATYQRLGAFEPATKGSGTASVAAALAVFLRHGRNFERLILEAANMLGSDTDTIGAMAGSLAGGFLGYTEIPERWATIMADYTYLNRSAEFLTLVALRRAVSNPLRLDGFRAPPGGEGSLLAALTKQQVVERHRYWHPLFGLGWATKVESQEIGRPRVKGRVIMATVQFDIGQTCKFSSYSGIAGIRKAGDVPRRCPAKGRDQIGLDL
jgi:ADP-ribosylglycohydrolase